MDKITDAARAEDRERELAAIAAHLAVRGVTRCPPAFAGIVNAAVPAAEEQRRLRELRPPPVARKGPGNWATIGSYRR
jgi:hypothetical protein